MSFRTFLLALFLFTQPSEGGVWESEFYAKYFAGTIPTAVRVVMHSDVIVEGKLVITAEGSKEAQVSETTGKIEVANLLYGFASPPKEVFFHRPAGRNFVFAESKSIAPFHGWENPSKSHIPVVAFLNLVDGEWNLFKVVPIGAEGSDHFIADLKLLQEAGVRRGAVVPARLSFDGGEHPLACGVIFGRW